MQKYLILAQSDITAKALCAWRALICCEALHGSENTPEPIILDPLSSPEENGVLAYHALAARIASVGKLNEDLSDSAAVVVMVDSIRPSRLSAIAEGRDWDHIVAMLILTFPEIRWVFAAVSDSATGWTCRDADGNDVSFPKHDHDLVSQVTTPQRAPLLDPTGLREWVRTVTNATLAARKSAGGHTQLLPRRKEVAAAIDDESEYAYLHGYAAYRYGFRADVVTSWTLMNHLFGQEREKVARSHGYSLLFEDMRLQFPDKPSSIRLSRLDNLVDPQTDERGRAFHCPLLDNDRDTSLWRFLITTGQMGHDDDDIVENNRHYLERKTAHRGRGDRLFKPLGGLTDLWQTAGLYVDLRHGTRDGNADGFVWPPPTITHGASDDGGGHSAPGRLALIAATLVKRALAIQRVACTVAEFVQGAVITTEAAELLGGRTPTLALSAICLKNEFEVKAERAFLGAGYHCDLSRRFRELEREVDSVEQWFHEDVRTKAALDAQMSVVNRLILVFRERGQVDEEQACLVKFRQLNRDLAVRNAQRKPMALVANCFLWYSEKLLANGWRLVGASILWLGVLVVARMYLSGDAPWHAFSRVVGSFFGGNGADIETGPVRWSLHALAFVAVAGGVFHVGLLISYLYSLISRK